MDEYKIVNTDNFGSDYPNERFIDNLPYLSSEWHAQTIADAINNITSPNCSRFWKVVKMPYTLQPGFKP